MCFILDTRMILFWDFDILPNFPFVIISNKYDIYELPNELRFRILGN